MPPSKTIHWAELVILLLILVSSLGTRVAHGHEGLPYLHHEDEPHIAGNALRILKSGDPHPGSLHYGSVTVYMMVAVDALRYLWLNSHPDGLWLRSHPDGEAQAPMSLESIEPETIEGYRWETSHPSFILWNRGLCALLGSLSVLLVFLIGRRVSAIVGLVSAAILAIIPVHIVNSAIVGPDIPVVCFTLLTVALSLAYMRSARASTLFWAFVAAGLSVATKYNTAPVLAAPLLALALGPEQRGAQRALWLAWSGPCIALGTFFALVPYALLDLPLFLTHVGYEVAHYSFRGHGSHTVEGGLPHVAWVTVQMASSLTWPGFVLGCGGVMGSLFADRRRSVLFIFPLLYILMQTQMVVAFHRNLLLLYPYLALGLGFVVDRALRWSGSKPVVWRRGLATLVIGGLTWAHIDQIRVARSVLLSEESRTTAAREIAQLAREYGWKRIGISEKLRIHPLDLARIDMGCIVAALPRLRSVDKTLDVLICPTSYAPALSGRESAELYMLSLQKALPTTTPLWSIEGAPTTMARVPVNPGVQIFVPPFE